MPSVCVVIVNYNSSELTCRCIAGIKEYIGDNMDVVVVDNSPFNETPEISAKHPDVVTIRPSRNLGFAGGCNLGLQYAFDKRIDYIQLLNPDTRIEHNFITRLVTVLEENDKIAIAAPKILRDSPERDVWYGGGRMNWWKGGPSQIFDDRNDVGDDVQPVSVVSGCAMLIRRTAAVRVGKMSEDYFLYFEDTDYVQRFLAAGYKIVYVPGAEILHDASSTVGFQSAEYIYYFSRNRIWFMWRWAKWYHFLFFMSFNSLIKMPGVLVIFGILQHRPDLVKAYWRGYLHGLTGAAGRHMRESNSVVI